MWGKTTSPEYLQKYPAHLTPMLEEEGLPRGTLGESCAIMAYLCNKHGLDQFYPTDPGERAMVDNAMFYLIGTFYPLLTRATYPALGFGQYPGEVATSDADDEMKAKAQQDAEAALAEPLEVYRTFFLDGKPFIGGDHPVDRRHPPGRDARVPARDRLRLPGVGRGVHGPDGGDARRGLLGAGRGRARLHRLREVAGLELPLRVGRMRHAILGAGGVGSLVGGALARAGDDVVLLLRPETLARHPGRLRVESVVLGDFEVEVATASALDREVDVCWVTAKATQLEAALELASAERVADAVLVPLLNGIDHVGLLRDRYEHVLAATFRAESERVEPGLVRQKTPFLRVDLGPGPRRDEIAEALRAAGLDVVLAPDEPTVLWEKLALLAPLALTTTAHGAPVGGVQADPEWNTRLLPLPRGGGGGRGRRGCDARPARAPQPARGPARGAAHVDAEGLRRRPAPRARRDRRRDRARRPAARAPDSGDGGARPADRGAT